MKKTLIIALLLFVSFGTGLFVNNTLFAQKEKNATKVEEKKPVPLKLGAFSMSLSVKDLKVSRDFYEKLGFTVFGGGMEQNYLIMKNGNALVGLFQGMFEGNILTFNPGWNENAKNVKKFDDVRKIQQHLKANGVVLTMEASDSTTGPASVMLTDPDGNLILLDQHR